MSTLHEIIDGNVREGEVYEKLDLCHLGRKFQEVLQITKLVTVLEVCDTEAAAVASFSK